MVGQFSPVPVSCLLLLISCLLFPVSCFFLVL